MSAALGPAANGAPQTAPPGGKWLGVTPPIALNGPSEKEKEVTLSLEAELKAQDMFESEAEAKIR